MWVYVHVYAGGMEWKYQDGSSAEEETIWVSDTTVFNLLLINQGTDAPSAKGLLPALKSEIKH